MAVDRHLSFQIDLQQNYPNFDYRRHISTIIIYIMLNRRLLGCEEYCNACYGTGGPIDPINLHTYDTPSWMVLILCQLIFAFICFFIGWCLNNRRNIKKLNVYKSEEFGYIASPKQKESEYVFKNEFDDRTNHLFYKKNSAIAPPEPVLNCPICHKSIPESSINLHLDQCIKSEQMNNKPPSKQAPLKPDINQRIQRRIKLPLNLKAIPSQAEIEMDLKTPLTPKNNITTPSHLSASHGESILIRPDIVSPTSAVAAQIQPEQMNNAYVKAAFSV
eukprot:197030_1